MKKEPMTLHIEPLLKYALAEQAEKGNYKNVNTFVCEILLMHIKKKQTEDKLFLEITGIKEQIQTISEVLELMATK